MSEFEDQIISKLSEELEIAEASRKTALRSRNKAIWSCAGAAVVCIATTIFLVTRSSDLLVTLCPMVMAALLGYTAYSNGTEKPDENYRYVYKNIILKNIARELQPDMEFHPDLGMSRQVFVDSRHYLSGADRFDSEDLFDGKIGATEVMFSEVHAEHRSESLEFNGDSLISWSTTFKGGLFVADFHKHFRSWVLVKPEAAGGWLSEKALNMSRHLEIMENEDFEKYYRVYGSDPVVTRYILTPDMQQRILDLRKIFGKGMTLSFIDSKVYITVPHREDWFEYSMHMDARSKKQITTMIHQMNQYFQIVETLDLNTRIWTKQ